MRFSQSIGLIGLCFLAACSDAGEHRLSETVNTALDSTGAKLGRLGDRIDTTVRGAVADSRAPKDAIDSVNVRNDAAFANNKDLRSDARWVAEAANDGMLEVELGKLAPTNGAAPTVKSFGQTMVSEHSKANAELQSLAGKKGITLPTEMSARNRDKLMEMMQKTGADFDQAYIDHMVREHRDDIDHYEDMANDGHDAELRTFAARSVPVLKNHLQMAESVQNAVKSKQQKK
jgi:putative membrane protein